MLQPILGFPAVLGAGEAVTITPARALDIGGVLLPRRRKKRRDDLERDDWLALEELML